MMLLRCSSTSPEEWQDFSNENIELAERERQNSTNLRSNIDGILQQVSNDQRKQVDATNLAFNKRIDETKDTKGKLEDHLNRVRGFNSVQFNSIQCNSIQFNSTLLIQ
jgi:hypothetical protein